MCNPQLGVAHSIIKSGSVAIVSYTAMSCLVVAAMVHCSIVSILETVVLALLLGTSAKSQACVYRPLIIIMVIVVAYTYLGALGPPPFLYATFSNVFPYTHGPEWQYVVCALVFWGSPATS